MMYTKEEIEKVCKKLGEEQPWNHDIELPFGVRTISKDQKSHGKNLIKWKRIKPYLENLDVEGKRVLDVGCSDGFFSIKTKEYGAREVVGIDADNERIKKAKFVATVCKIDNVSFKKKDVLTDELEDLGRFDLILCLGFLHRIPEVYTAIKILTRMSDSILFEWKASRYNAEPVLEFRGARSKDGNELSKLYWAPSISFVVEILKSFGFTDNFAVEDKTKWRRMMLFSSRLYHPIFKNGIKIAEKSKCSLLYKYSIIYLKNIYKVLIGRITL